MPHWWWPSNDTFAILARITESENRIMATLEEVLQDDADLQTEVATIGNSVAVALAKLADVEAALAALQAGGGLTEAQQAQVDQLATDLTAAKDALTTTDGTIQTALAPPA